MERFLPEDPEQQSRPRSPATTVDTVDLPDEAGHISLNDNSRPPEEEAPASLDIVNLDGVPISRLSTRVGTGRLREELARRKYARFQQERYEDEVAEEDGGRPSASTTRTDAGSTTVGGSPKLGDKAKESRYRRGEKKVKGLVFGKKQRRRLEGDAEIDILWENQRGSFFFGRPYYSSNSLLNFDPSSWTNVYNKASAVDIISATVPDPSWEWAWKTWYVDMSIDCDEQGWQYSFMFQNRFAWHGTHPWFHSFVRRRRWIRKRVRKNSHERGRNAVKEAHKLNADYFTIHPSAHRDADSSYPPSTTGAQQYNNSNNTKPDEEEAESVDNIRDLNRRLKKASVDREKVNLVLRFMDEGGQDVHYLADEMPHIMSLFMYQYSQRQLLAAMLRKADGRASGHRDQGSKKGKEASNHDAEDDSNRPKMDDIDKAVEAADKLVKDFEYWSDIKEVVQSGETITGVSAEEGWGDGWQGLDRSGPGKTSEVEDEGGATKLPAET